MRLLERTLKWVGIAPRAEVRDDLGAALEAFSPNVTRVRASVIPSLCTLDTLEEGLRRAGDVSLLLPADAVIQPGDGLCIDGDAPQWRCTEVQQWSAHVAVKAVRIPG